ncbi:type II toxin-antitoxin system RelE/ParE family toxin [Novosphingobium resinovorum]|uniref:type II toxin-antitoxin system RelE family toxin n=1 Tax=Novosphingobium resinovorum TaxID=158500 RepID=UPI002ED5F5A6
MAPDIKRQAVRKLDTLLEQPRIPAARLRGGDDCYKIKLRAAGYRVIYQVIDARLVILIVAACKRDSAKDDVYTVAMNRLRQADDE